MELEVAKGALNTKKVKDFDSQTTQNNSVPLNSVKTPPKECCFYLVNVLNE